MLTTEIATEIAELLANLGRLEAELVGVDESHDPVEQQLALALIKKCAEVRGMIRMLRQDLDEQGDIAAMRDRASDRAYARWVQ